METVTETEPTSPLPGHLLAPPPPPPFSLCPSDCRVAACKYFPHILWPQRSCSVSASKSSGMRLRSPMEEARVWDVSFNKSWAESAGGFQVWFLANPMPAQQRSMGIPCNFCPPEIPELQKLPSLTLTLPDSFCKPLIACMKPHLVEVPRMCLSPRRAGFGITACGFLS